MSLIYEPKGKAREYSPLALNIYNGCDHGCKYCYVPMIMRKQDASKTVKERTNFLYLLEKELNKNTYKDQILLSFMCDPYNHHNDIAKTTALALRMLNRCNCKVAVLTKSGTRCLKDLDIFKSFGDRIKIGTTLTFTNNDHSYDIEPKAALPDDRLEMLKILEEQNIKTFVSIEPVIDTKQSLTLIRRSLNFTDQYKIGKMNYFEKKFTDKPINWSKFLYEAVEILRKNNKQFYIKEDLRKFDHNKILTKIECDYNYLNL